MFIFVPALFIPLTEVEVQRGAAPGGLIALDTAALSVVSDAHSGDDPAARVTSSNPGSPPWGEVTPCFPSWWLLVASRGALGGHPRTRVVFSYLCRLTCRVASLANAPTRSFASGWVWEGR